MNRDQIFVWFSATAYIVFLLVAVAFLSGCASAPKEKIRYIKVKSDSYCKADRPIKWHPKDTRETINDIRRHNRAYEKGCK